jgi:hypothetical protein
MGQLPIHNEQQQRFIDLQFINIITMLRQRSRPSLLWLTQKPEGRSGRNVPPQLPEISIILQTCQAHTPVRFLKGGIDILGGPLVLSF